MSMSTICLAVFAFMTVPSCFDYTDAGMSWAQVDVLPGRTAPSGKGSMHEALVAAAERGDPGAQFRLGTMYENGHGLTQDFSTAATWYERAVKGGHRSAMTNLAALYYEGRGVPRDYNLSAELYAKASDLGDAAARTVLGSMYAEGRGVKKDIEQARSLYLSAARAGYKYAYGPLGTSFLLNGNSRQESLVEAGAWFKLGEEAGDDFASSNLQSVIAQLSASDQRRLAERAKVLRRDLIR